MKGRFASGLQDLSSSSDSSGDQSSDAGEDAGGTAGGESKRQREKDKGKGKGEKPEGAAKRVTVEDLKKNGYRAGSSVLLVPDAGGNESWNWSDGREHARASKEGTSRDARESNRAAASEATALAVKRGIEYTNSLRKLKKKEWKEKRRGDLLYDGKTKKLKSTDWDDQKE